jgi:hypothetical protein
LLRKSLYNGYYALVQPKRWLTMNRKMKEQSWPSAPKVIAVYHEADPFSTSVLVQALAQANGWQFEARLGGHDDVWLDPSVYVELLQ